MRTASTVNRSLGILVGKIFRGLSGFLYALAVARAYGPEGSGLYFLSITIIHMASQVAQFGLTQGFLKFIPTLVAEGKVDLIPRFVGLALRIELAVTAAVVLLLYAAAPRVSVDIFSQPNLELILRCMLPALIGWALIRVLGAAWQARNDMGGIIIYENLYLPTLLLSGAILAGFMHRPAWEFALFTGIAYCLVGALLWHASSGRIGAISPFKSGLLTTVGSERLTTLLRYSIPLMGVGLVQQMIMWSDTLMIGYFMAAEDVGIYNVAVRVAMATTLLLYAVNTTITPLIASHCATRDWGQLREIYRKSVYYLVFLSLPLFFLIVVFRDMIIGIFGQEFDGAGLPLSILLVGQFINVATGPSGYVLLLSGKDRLEILNISATFLLNVTLNIALIPRWGLTGAAVATSTAMSVVNLLRVAQNAGYIGWPWTNRAFIEMIVLFGTSTLVALLPMMVWGMSRYLAIPAMLLFFVAILVCHRDLVLQPAKRLLLRRFM